MAPERLPVDNEVRERVTHRLDTTFLLEAGAGSGKTRVLVERYVNCLLDVGRRHESIGRVAAITFTERAAGELREKIRARLETRSDDPATPTGDREILRSALTDLDDAPISTIHGFAARLLREFPVEAGIDPAFAQLDALGAAIELSRLWEEWLTGLAVDEQSETAASRALARLLRAGVRLESVRDLAIGKNGVFGERYDLKRVEPPMGEPGLAAGLRELAGPLRALATFCDAACTDKGRDLGYRDAVGLVERCSGLVERWTGAGGAHPERVGSVETADAATADTDRIAADLFALKYSTAASAPGGATGNWEPSLGGKPELQARFAALTGALDGLRGRYADHITGLALAVAWSFTDWAGRELGRSGQLDFADLLGRLRDLLAGRLTGGDLSARAALRQRFRYLLVDEFQDTDPLQAEIVFFLCERADGAEGETDWKKVRLEPGKLFVVGDPKQSIYRFRRADIRLYGTVQGLIAGQPGGSGAVEHLSVNFRTVPDAVGWVNRVFADVFDADRGEGRQPGYEAVHAHRLISDDRPRVALLCGPSAAGDGGGAGAVRRAESRAVAALLRDMCGDGREEWMIEAGRVPPGAEPVLRPPRWSDISVLYRATTGLESLEQALREAGVPYRVDGGTSYFRRREVDDALLCLRAVDDPGDGPAVYGALHSTFFGFSDGELFSFWADHGRFEPFCIGQPTDRYPEVAAALDTLRRLHLRRAELEPHELVDLLVQRLHAREFLAATGRGAAQAIANLEKLVERARAYTRAGGGGLGEFIAWAAQAGDSGGESESQVDDDGDAVRLLTIHKAKGLEAPIVVLVGGSLASFGGGGEPIVDRAGGDLGVTLKVELPGSAPRTLASTTYSALQVAEKAMAASELRRLLYVAATRAEDHLVVSQFARLTTKSGGPLANVLLAPLAGHLPDVTESVEACVDDGVLVLPANEPPARTMPERDLDISAMLEERATWRAERARRLAEAARPARATSPSGLEHADDDPGAPAAGVALARARALALGTAVHRVMELCDLSDAASLPRVAAGVCAELGRDDLSGEVGELALACWRAAPVRAAAGAAAADPGAVYRELPVGVCVGDAVVSGAVDLVYRRDVAGHLSDIDSVDEWIVVDYKTDRDTDPAALRERYAAQAEAYALAVEGATGGRVAQVALVAARARVGVDDADTGVVLISTADGLQERVAREVARAIDERRAVAPDEAGQDPSAEF